jgi:hypothetical protein
MEQQIYIALEGRLTGVENNLRTLGDDMKDIKDCLLGNDFNKTGIIHTIAEHHQRLNMLERTLERGKWLVIGLSMGTGGFIWEMIKYLIKL